jgi:hypothetical protein
MIYGDPLSHDRRVVAAQGDSVLNLPPAQGLANGLCRIQNVVRIGKQRFADAVGGWRG